MNDRQKFLSLIVTLTLVLLGPTAFAADHREAPLIAEDLTADIADIYAFRNPTISGSLVLIMTVNGFSAPAENVTFNFAPDVLYRFNIDNDGNAKPDHTIDFRFTSTVPGPQLFEARFSSGFEITGTVTLPSEEVVPNEPIIVEGPEGVRAFAGQRDDPFFFDVVGFFRFLAGTGSFTGTDGFAGFNVSAIAVEIPLDMLSDRNDHHGDDDDDDGTGALQIWAETLRPRVTVRRTRHDLQRHRGRFVQIERMGNPAINTALIPPELKDLFNVSRPKNDAEKFAPAIVESLMADPAGEICTK